MDEPSVLDYVKSRLMPWKYPRLSIPEEDAPPLSEEQTGEEFSIIVEAPGLVLEEPAAEQAREALKIPWRSLAALGLAAAAQWRFWPGAGRAWQPGAILLLVSVGLLAWATYRDEWAIEPIPDRPSAAHRRDASLGWLMASGFAALATFWSFGSLQFDLYNITFLVLSATFLSLAFWQPGPGAGERRSILGARSPLSSISAGASWRWLVVGALIGLVVFFRFYRLGDVPPEMNSDHAEKIQDVLRVLAGQTGVFFPNNGGREALQFYLVAALHRFFNIPLGFTILKLATAIVGFLALPYIYLIGKEVANRRAGLLAFTFAGIAYWPNVVSRVGLRLPFYTLFSAATLYYLLRGIQRGQRNDFILAGIALGLSLYGYSADRILPLLVLLAIGLYLIHRQSAGRRRETVMATLILVTMSLVLFLPLLRYMLEEPQGFLFRTLTRMGGLERPLEGPAWLIFLSNTWNALKMFSWSGGVVWPISIPDHPALGVIPAALFYLGAALLLLRYLRKRHWMDLFLLVAIPVLMLPSILALAFPAENPNLYRTGGAVVPVFLIVGIALDGLLRAFEIGHQGQASRRLAWSLAAVLLALSARQDYDLVFQKYYQQYRLSAWNSSEMGQVVTDFIDLFGNPESVWVVGYPHWVDTRLVGLNAGLPGRDLQIFREEFESTLAEPGPKLFILNPQDEESLGALKAIYPSGWQQRHGSQVATKEFVIYFVPPD